MVMRRPAAWGSALALLCGLVLLTGVTPAAADDAEFVKYYTVQSTFQGAPENLAEIAARFLGGGDRSTEILTLNGGRRQPDGGTLTDPAKLHAGWALVLPWDAVGDLVRYGLLPTVSPGPTAAPSRRAPAGTADGCTAVAASSTRSDWAALRLAPDQAWARTRGKGQLVAIVDSGVDATQPQLAGHVTAGSDVVAAGDKADTDCLGTGTAMAGLVVAQQVKGSALSGVAPDATVVPIRVVTTATKAQPADAATGIAAATSAGATVIALGSTVDPGEPRVAAAIAAAATHDVVVVTGAPSGSAPVDASVGPPSRATLRVGGVGVDSQPAAAYRAGAVDIVAPGVNVTSVGIGGATGTQYAVAFVAGEAALVRAGYPDLTAAQVVHRIEATADTMGDAAPDSRYGWGMINPGAAVTRALAEEGRSVARTEVTTSPPGDREAILVVAALVGLSAAVLLVVRVRRLLRPPGAG